MKMPRKYILSFFMLIVAFSIEAQDIKKFPRIRMLLMETQLTEMKKNIVIDNNNVSKFDQIYRKYIMELSDLNLRNQGPALLDSSLDQISDGEVEDIFIKQTDRSKRLLILREKYFYEFKSVMKPKDIILMYKIEREITRKVQQELRKRENNRQLK